MVEEEFKFFDHMIILEAREKIKSSYKINIYKKQIQYMDKNKIPQKPIKELLRHLFFENTIISNEVKKSISKIIYSESDKLIILITSSGKEFIHKRNELVNQYGWFFYLVDKEKKSKKDHKISKKQKKEEITISTQTYNIKDISIELEEKQNMRSLYFTKEYFHYSKFIKSNNIPQMDIHDVLNHFFQDNKLVPFKEKKGIKKAIYYHKERVIVVKSLIGDKMYEHLTDLVRLYGWYFYITGVPVGSSDICQAIDEIPKRYDQEYFKNINLNTSNPSSDIRITIYPIVLKPNHNCHILGIGDINILIDCGISESSTQEEEEQNIEKKKDDFEHIEDYLANLSLLISEAEKKSTEQLEVVEDNEEEFPSFTEANTFEPKSKAKIDALFISHSHYDHVSGLKRLIEIYPDIPILTSRITLDLFLLRDSNFLKQESHDSIEQEEYRNIIQNVIYVENGEKVEFQNKNCYLSFFHAGHMPGALMFLAKINDFRFLYTGDYTYHDITPFAGTRRFLEQISRPIDYLLIDGTSATEDHGHISDQFHSLILFLEQKAEYEDNVLIGADPSSLAITFMLIFWRYFRKLQLRKGFKKRPNIYVDMMVKKNIEVINHRYEYIYGPISRLIKDKANPFNSIKFRWFDLDDLNFLRERNNIIISHPPDLSYGIIRNIINSVGRNPHNLVFLAGSIHESPGIELVEGGDEIEFTDTWIVPFRALLLNTFAPQLQIKLHADKNQLAEMVKALEPREVCFFHQSAKKLIEAVDHVKDLGVEKVSLPKKRKLLILN
jgi:Cft2 family RNA processing exonuclease